MLSAVLRKNLQIWSKPHRAQIVTFCHFQTWICTADFNVPCLSLLILTTKVGTNTLDREKSQRHCLNSGMGQPNTAAQGSHVRRGAVPCLGSLSHQILLTMRGSGTGTCLIPGQVHPHSSMLTDQLLPYVWGPPGRAPSLSPWTMVTVRLQTPGSQSGHAALMAGPTGQEHHLGQGGPETRTVGSQPATCKALS